MKAKKVKTRDLCLDIAARKVAEMWERVDSSGIHRATANDTIHFVHEEASEVTKVAMKLGLIGGRQYVRSAAVESRGYDYADLIMEVGDVILMALTLAQAFGLEPSVCLAQSLRKFYARAAEAEGKMTDDLRAQLDTRIPTPAEIRQRDLEERTELRRPFNYPYGCVPPTGSWPPDKLVVLPEIDMAGGALATGLAIITSDAKHRAHNCEGFVPRGEGEQADYCERCGAAEYLHGPPAVTTAEGVDYYPEPDDLCTCGHVFSHHGERWPDDDHPLACCESPCNCEQFQEDGVELANEELCTCLHSIGRHTGIVVSGGEKYSIACVDCGCRQFVGVGS